MSATDAAPRLDYLDAARAFALLLGVVFHASLSFMPAFIGWAVMDVSTSPLVAGFALVSHSFRMELFFLIAGFFARMSFHRRGARAFLRERFVRIVLPFVAGWFLLRPLLVSGWIMGKASLRGEVDAWAGLRGGFQSLASLPAGLFTGTHLWFLYYLAAITLAALALRWLLEATGWRDASGRAADRAMDWLARSRLALAALILPTAAALWFMRHWGMDTPDRSLQLHLPVAAVYGGFFALGWGLHRRAELLPRFIQLSAARWVVAGVSIGLCLWLAGFQSEPGHPSYQLARAAFALAYAAMMWSLVLLALGVSRKAIQRPNFSIRYLADASYWLYLIHLPIVVWLQVAFAELPWHWTLKLAAISGLTIGVSLLLYDALVRPTILGRALNGRRKAPLLGRSRVSRCREPARETGHPQPLRPTEGKLP